jgi:hypothetical protein
MEHLILIFQGGKDFEYQLDKVRSFQAAQLLILKVDLFISWRKSLYYNLKMRKYGKRVL